MAKKKDSSVTDEEENKKMSIYDYEEKYVKRQNVRGARLILSLITGVIAVFLAWCLFSMVVKIWEINVYAGYAAIAVAVLLYIFLFIVPMVKIYKSDYFETNVNSKHAYSAKRHNKKVRRNIAAKMVDFNASVDGVGWYDDKLVGDLEVALKTNDDEGLKTALTALYQGKVKKTAKEIIFKCSLKSAAYSAVSQSNRMDAALVAVVNLQMIKDIVFLYGFRPSDAKLVKIFGAVVRNSLISYGLGSAQIGNAVAKSVGDVAKGIPILGSAISALVDSSIQGLTNGTLTAVIGFQTIRYLNKEYKLQDVLDGIEVAETEEELQAACEELEGELKKRPAKVKVS
ncbi:MAG: YcjF family protein [Candidatus Coproplasma sp.]